MLEGGLNATLHAEGVIDILDFGEQRAALYRAALRRTAPHRTAPHRTALHRTVPGDPQIVVKRVVERVEARPTVLTP